jgi:hypothetical protein
VLLDVLHGRWVLLRKRGFLGKSLIACHRSRIGQSNGNENNGFSLRMLLVSMAEQELADQGNIPQQRNLDDLVGVIGFSQPPDRRRLAALQAVIFRTFSASFSASQAA